MQMKRTIATTTMVSLLCASRLFGGEPYQTVTQDVPFAARCDGTEQKYVLLARKTFTSAAPRDVLIALHGHGSDRWQFIKDGRDECRAARDFAAEHDMLYVSPDYRASTSWMGPKKGELLHEKAGIRERIRRIDKEGSAWLEPMENFLNDAILAETKAFSGSEQELRGFHRRIGVFTVSS